MYCNHKSGARGLGHSGASGTHLRPLDPAPSFSIAGSMNPTFGPWLLVLAFSHHSVHMF